MTDNKLLAKEYFMYTKTIEATFSDRFYALHVI